MVKHILALGAMGLGIGLGVVGAPYLSSDVLLVEDVQQQVKDLQISDNVKLSLAKNSKFTSFDFHHSYIDEFNNGVQQPKNLLNTCKQPIKQAICTTFQRFSFMLLLSIRAKIQIWPAYISLALGMLLPKND